MALQDLTPVPPVWARILGSVGRAEETSAFPQLARSLIPLEWIYLVEFPEFSIQQRMRFL